MSSNKCTQDEHSYAWLNVYVIKSLSGPSEACFHLLSKQNSQIITGLAHKNNNLAPPPNWKVNDNS